MENLQTMLPMLYSEGVRAGRHLAQRLVEVTSTNAAKLFGLYPRKGTIAVGSDADIVVFDPDLTRTIERAMLKSNAGYSVYEGWEVTGWPVITLRRGEVVFRDDEVHRPARVAANSWRAARRSCCEGRGGSETRPHRHQAKGSSSRARSSWAVAGAVLRALRRPTAARPRATV